MGTTTILGRRGRAGVALFVGLLVPGTPLDRPAAAQPASGTNAGALMESLAGQVGQPHRPPASPTQAAPAGSAAPAAADPAPDLVRLQDGAEFRGRILERTPAFVRLLLPTGEERRIDASWIRYAGPDRRESSAIEGTIHPDEVPEGYIGPRVRVQVDSDDDERLVLYAPRTIGATVTRVVHSSTDHGAFFGKFLNVEYDWIPICTTPCSMLVPVGTLRLGAAPLRADGSPPPGEDAIRLPARYVDRDASFRASASLDLSWLWYVLGGSVVFGVGVWAYAEGKAANSRSAQIAYLSTSLGSFIASTVLFVLAAGADRSVGFLDPVEGQGGAR